MVTILGYFISVTFGTLIGAYIGDEVYDELKELAAEKRMKLQTRRSTLVTLTMIFGTAFGVFIIAEGRLKSLSAVIIFVTMIMLIWIGTNVHRRFRMFWLVMMMFFAICGVIALVLLITGS